MIDIIIYYIKGETENICICHINLMKIIKFVICLICRRSYFIYKLKLHKLQVIMTNYNEKEYGD